MLGLVRSTELSMIILGPNETNTYMATKIKNWSSIVLALAYKRLNPLLYKGISTKLLE